MKSGWLERIAPRPYNLWKGRWKGGAVEPTRYIFDHELVVVSEGGCSLRVGRETRSLRAGMFAIVPPGTLHTTVTAPGGVVRHCVHFDWTFLPPRRRGLPLWIHPPLRPRASDLRPAPAWVPRKLAAGRFDLKGPVVPLMEAAFRRWHSGSAFERAACAATVAEMLLELLWGASRHAGSRDRGAELADRVKEKIDAAALDDAPIQQLLASLGFSYAHLCRLFTARFGLAPARYRNAVRLERARQLLHEPGRTVAEAAYAAGFRDPAYFTRKFSERHGVPPSRWRP